MRLLPILLVAACGNSPSKAKDADTPPGEPPPPPVDAFVLPPCPNPVSGTTVAFRKLNPVPDNLGGIAALAVSPPLDAHRLFVLRIDGQIRLFRDEVLQPTPFLDLSPDAGGPVTSGSEMGLLGMAFHPQFASNGTFFIYYTTGTPQAGTLRDVLARCQISGGDPDVADPTSCVEVLSVKDPAANHNGGMLEFGSDGYLYLAIGDGGGNFNLGRSQDPNQLLGKMLRLDVDHKATGLEYAIPPDNPFAAGGGLPEIYMLGLRNPWRWSFDRETGDLWLGDVGAATIEELDVLAPSEQNGANLGWSIWEGSVCHTPPCDAAGFTFPKHERERTATGWAAIIGGQVYRGTCFPDLVGWYLFADDIRSAYARARLNADRTLEVVDLPAGLPARPVSLHADARGEIYLTDVSGFVYRLEASP